ncbi:putative 3',5'-cyclic phosphodiesterase pde-5 isoform X2 [Tachypleus tridentatus]
MMRSSSHDETGNQDLNSEKVAAFLHENPDFIEEYVINNVELELLERWVIRASQKARKRPQSMDVNGRPQRKTSLSRWKFCVHADKRKMLQELTTSLYTNPSKGQVLSELVATVASAVNADRWNLYLYDKTIQELSIFTTEKEQTNPEGSVHKIENTENTVAAFVAKTLESVRTINTEQDSRFPDGAAVEREPPTYILAHPIQQPDGELTGVLELYRDLEAGPFYEEDEEIINSYLVWGGIALHYAEMYSKLARQRKLNNFLLAVVRSIFQDMIVMDSVIVKIMTFGQKLVNADRASLFLVDRRSKELYARIFDVSGDPEDESAKTILETSNEIRFPIGKGIAGHVALTGHSLNIPDVYDDHRFNRTVDQQTGYRTRSLLCMPIFIRNKVIGVVQMVNKESGPFTKTDEEAFATFATYCGLALHHAKLYDKIRRSEQKYKVALEVLSYHNTCTEMEVNEIKHSSSIHNTQSLMDFQFSPHSLDYDQKVSAAIFMFIDLFGLHKFDEDYLIRFTLTVRKNYRRVPYHNWEHGFTVANAMYAIIKNARGTFKPLEELALFVACLCHDLDHRGKNNQFMVTSASPLAAIYTTSTLEHHHFNQSVSILQQDGHNIFKNLSSGEYKQVLRNIKHCILATDLALFFQTKDRLREIVFNEGFDSESNEHRILLQAIAMTACDLCASTKPWEEQRKTVKVIFEEFYEQGDAEKARGREPVPMMDRTKTHEQPASQVGFLTAICKPCYEILAAIIPESRPMLDGCL